MPYHRLPIRAACAFLCPAAFLLSVLPLAAALEWSPEGSPGADGIWDLQTENWLDGAGRVAYVPFAEASFPAVAGTVDVAGFIEAGRLTFEGTGTFIQLDNASGSGISTPGISGNPQFGFKGLISADADDYPSLAALRGRGLEFRPQGAETFSGEIYPVLGGSPVVAVTGDSGRVAFDGRWWSDSGTIIPWLRLEDGGHFVLTEAADMRFIKEGFFTLQLWVTGDGTGTLELAEGFVADHTDGGLVRKGIGSIRMGAGTLITHDSQNLPLGYRPRADGSAQTNGHLVFENTSGGRWIVRGNDQVYPGAVWIFRDMEVVTEADLIHMGVTEGSANYTAWNGWSALRPVTVTKRGPATLALAGEQSWAAGSSLDVAEGGVSLQSDPAGGQSLSGQVSGAQLSLQVREGARLEWSTGGAIQTLYLNGDLLLDGQLRIENGGFAQFALTSSTEILLQADLQEPLISSVGPVFPGGRLVVNRLPGYLPEAGAEWILCQAPDFAGSWELEDRTGLGLQLVAGENHLKLVAGRAAPDLPGRVILEDTFDGPSGLWKDLSTVPRWGAPLAAGTAFEWADGVVRLQRSGSRDTTNYTRYNLASGLKTFTALDHQFDEAVAHAGSEVTIDFRMRWPQATDGSGEEGRVLVLLNHDYPEGGLDLTPEGEAGTKIDDFSEAWWARPAYHVRLRNSTTRAGSSFLQYGGGRAAEGEYERTGGWWLPGFVSGAGQVAPGAGDEFPANSWVATRTGMADSAFRSFRYRLLPDRQELWRDDNDDGMLQDGELKAVMPLPAESEAPLYQYFTTFEGIRIFWNGVGGSGQAEFDWMRVIVQDNLSPRVDAGEEAFAQVLVEGNAPVVLDASGTVDPEGESLLYAWFLDGEPVHLTRDSRGMALLPVGEHELELVVLDPAGNYAVDTGLMTVTEGKARPVANAGGERVITASNDWFGIAGLSASASYSPNGDIVRYRWSTGNPQRVLYEGDQPTTEVALGIGTHIVELTVWDVEGLFTTTSVRVVVEPAENGGPLEVLYRENFSRTRSGGEMGPWEVGWNLMRYDGEPVASVQYDGNAHRSLSYDTWDTGPSLPRINANPTGAEPEGGNTAGHMWMNQMPFLNASPGEWMLWTDEYTIDRDKWELAEFSFHAKDGSPERVKVAPAVRIGGQWYLGWELRILTQWKTWRAYTINLDTAGWVLFEPSLIFSVRDAEAVDRLPDGDVDAFGLYMFKDYAWYVNEIDNFTVKVRPRQEPDPYGTWVVEVFPQDLLKNDAEVWKVDKVHDPDRDGWSNLWEFVMGSNPMEAGSSGLLTSVDSEGRVRLALPWNPEATNIAMTVMESADLVNWAPAVNVTVTDLPGEEAYSGLREWLIPSVSKPRFYRLEAKTRDPAQ